MKNCVNTSFFGTSVLSFTILATCWLKQPERLKTLFSLPGPHEGGEVIVGVSHKKILSFLHKALRVKTALTLLRRRLSESKIEVTGLRVIIDDFITHPLSHETYTFNMFVNHVCTTTLLFEDICKAPLQPLQLDSGPQFVFEIWVRLAKRIVHILLFM